MIKFFFTHKLILVFIELCITSHTVFSSVYGLGHGANGDWKVRIFVCMFMCICVCAWCVHVWIVGNVSMKHSLKISLNGIPFFLSRTTTAALRVHNVLDFVDYQWFYNHPSLPHCRSRKINGVSRPQNASTSTINQKPTSTVVVRYTTSPGQKNAGP